jgi:hypothetical protein
MKIYRVQISGDRYPTDYTVQASSWGTAISRAVREWQKKFKGSRTTELKIKAFKSGELLKTDEKNQPVEQ